MKLNSNIKAYKRETENLMTEYRSVIHLNRDKTKRRNMKQKRNGENKAKEMNMTSKC